MYDSFPYLMCDENEFVNSLLTICRNENKDRVTEIYLLLNALLRSPVVSGKFINNLLITINGMSLQKDIYHF